MKILILGNTPITFVCTQRLLRENRHHLVGYVPSVAPTLKGRMDLLLNEAPLDAKCDLRLSIQYDRRLEPDGKTFNVHTGLLPRWGGTDLLYHTIQLKEREQGLTFHLVTDEIDGGNILSKVTYPVLPKETIVDLYSRMMTVAPSFVSASLDLLAHVGMFSAFLWEKHEPRVFKRGQIDPEDREMYAQTLKQLKEVFE